MYEQAGMEPPPVIFTPHPNGPRDLLDEPMALSLADKAKLGMDMEPSDGFNSEHLQWELRMALERIHTNAGHSQPIGGVSPAENKPFDGMDPVSSALLMELAATVMPEKPPIVTNETRYTPAQRKVAIKRWMAKRARRHLTSQTKYRKMKDVAVGKARCKGGKFIKKSERERLERLEREAADAMLMTEAFAMKDSGAFQRVDKSEWHQAYNFYARNEE
jgi:hypothetical protein